MPQLIVVPRESAAGEKRVATVPDVVDKLLKLGFRVAVQSGAGDAANFADDTYRAAGAEIIDDAARLWAAADIVFKVRAPSMAEVGLMRAGSTLVSFVWPAQNPELMQALAAKKATVLAMDSVPRISRAQKLDALSSMANIAGYRAVIEAAHHVGRFFTGQITAAGKVPPAKVFVIGAGVGGLAAIGAASGLGAIVRANDTRPEVADQIKSLGGEFVPVEYVEEGSGGGGYAKVMSEGFQKTPGAVFARQAKEVDVIITTALIPGAAAATIAGVPFTKAAATEAAPPSLHETLPVFRRSVGPCRYRARNRPAAFIEHFTVFVLACFVGYMVIWNVTPALHTPLMSVTNAISSIIAIGALVQVAPPISDAGDRPSRWIVALALLSIALVAIN